MKTKMSVESSDVIPEEEKEEDFEELEEARDAQAPEAEEKTGDAGLKPKRQHEGDLRLVRRTEAALFLANRIVSYEELGKLLGVTRQIARMLVEKLKEEYDARGNAIGVVLGDEGAMFEAKSEFLENVSELSKKPDLSRKATKILALVAKKGGMLQSELRKYFRGEIYTYTTELKEAGYLDSEKRGSTRYLKPSKKFLENFQLA